MTRTCWRRLDRCGSRREGSDPASCSSGESPVYVQRQLGHASIKLTTLRHYAHAIPRPGRRCVNVVEVARVHGDLGFSGDDERAIVEALRVLVGQREEDRQQPETGGGRAAGLVGVAQGASSASM